MFRWLDPLPVTESSHTSRIWHAERKSANRAGGLAQNSLHGWLLSYAELRKTSSRELFVYHKKNIWATHIEFLHIWGNIFFYHLELGMLAKLVFSNIIFSVIVWDPLTAQNWTHTVYKHTFYETTKFENF